MSPRAVRAPASLGRGSSPIARRRLLTTAAENGSQGLNTPRRMVRRSPHPRQPFLARHARSPAKPVLFTANVEPPAAAPSQIEPKARHQAADAPPPRSQARGESTDRRSVRRAARRTAKGHGHNHFDARVGASLCASQGRIAVCRPASLRGLGRRRSGYWYRRVLRCLAGSSASYGGS
jgi:hypothetical protein